MARKKPSEQATEEKAAEATEKPRVVPIEEVLGGILHQMAINNRILADIHAKLCPRSSVAGLKAGPMES